jgi:hypothetical protein
VASVVRCVKDATQIAVGDILCFLTVRNELLRLPAVLDHHRQLGINRFIVIDNGSVDGTVEFLSLQSDVDLYTVAGSYSASHCGLEWVNPLLDEIANNHWVLTLDGDELFTYPHWEKMSLQKFCQFLDEKNAQAVFTIMLDMYSEKTIAQTEYSTGESLLDACPYFDRGPYFISQTKMLSKIFPKMHVEGGARRRVFWDRKGRFPPPPVSKVPLVKWNKGYRYIISTHYMRPSPRRLSDVTGALLHFKFLSDFHLKAKTEAERGEHYAGAREYKQYLAMMDQDPSLRLLFPGSMRYQSSEQLIELKLCRTSDDWENFVRR